MKAKYTKGPWHYYRNKKKPMVRAHNNRMIAQIIPHPGGLPLGQLYSPEDHANNVLIAAAPELVEAAKRVIETAPKSDNPFFWIAIKDLVAVVKKAQGEL